MIGTCPPLTSGRSIAVSRREVLRASGLVAAGLAAAPWPKRGGAQAQPATLAPVLGASAWDDLAGRLSGHLLRPDDAMYPAATIISAARYMGT